MNYPQVILKPDREQSWIFGHPWIFSKALQEEYQIPHGSLVSLFSSKGEPLGVGTFQKGSTIAVRMLTPFLEEINTEWFVKKLLALKKYRESFLKSTTNAYRLCYGESDGIPGLVIDLYNNHAVLQINTKGVELLLPYIQEAFLQLKIEVIRTLQDSTSAKKEGLVTQEKRALPKSTIWAKENDIVISIPTTYGQKTGWFCDQRDNRKLVLELVKEQKLKSVLNLFSYTGGFSLAALLGGATDVLSVDTDEEALFLLQEMAKKNHTNEDYHRELAQDVWHFLKSSKETFDLVIVDPPAFVKSEKKKKEGMKGYLDLFRASIPRVQTGQYLMVFSCSHFITEQDLNWVLRQAFLHTKRKFQTLSSLNQGFDHPVPAWFEEAKYLKGYLLKEIHG